MCEREREREREIRICMTVRKRIWFTSNIFLIGISYLF